ncbi:MAG: hypothetical protein M3Z05_09230 [Gemmatimonadota bacterium]|nr:hypothetical protein [Gemmatimonadota bacterium]
MTTSIHSHIDTLSVRALGLTALFAIGGCVHPTVQQPALAVTVLTAQAPHRFKLTEHIPSTVAAEDGVPITFRETVSIVAVSARDSAGGTIWELTVDSTSSVIVARDGVDPKRLTMQLGPVRIESPSRYRAFVSDTRTVALEADGQVIEGSFVVQYPEWSLLLQLQALSFLPRTALTVPVGNARVDTSVSQRRLPSGIWNDTMIVRWSHSTSAFIEGTFVHSERFASDIGRASLQEGMISVRLEPGGSVLETRIEERTRPRERP